MNYKIKLKSKYLIFDTNYYKYIQKQRHFLYSWLMWERGPKIQLRNIRKLKSKNCL